jgi:hypothetical protein
VCLADSSRVQCSSRVRRILARPRFRSVFVLGFCCSRFADGPSFSSGRSGSGADGPPGPRGQSVFSRFISGGSVGFYGLFVASCRTVRGTWPDCPRHLAGLSAWPLRTVRPSWPNSPLVPGSFAPWFDSSLLAFMLPRVLQGIIPKT